MEEFDAIMEKLQEEVGAIQYMVNKPHFDVTNSRYKLKLHFQIVKDCVNLLEELVIDKGVYRFYSKGEV